MTRHEKELIKKREFQGCALEFQAPPEVRDDGSAEPGEVYGRIVPYDTPTQIGRYVYEVMERGVFDKTLKDNPKGVPLLWGHNEADRMPMGRVKSFESKEDGMYVRFSLNDTSDARDARELFRSGDATGLSVSFFPVRNADVEHADGTMTIYRKEAILKHVAMTHIPAYPDAQIASMRSEEEPGQHDEVRTDEPETEEPEAPREARRIDRWIDYASDDES